MRFFSIPHIIPHHVMDAIGTWWTFVALYVQGLRSPTMLQSIA
jgi:hypothetical protein